MKLIIEGHENKLAIIQRRFRNFGVSFKVEGAEADNVEPTAKEKPEGSGSPDGEGDEKPKTPQAKPEGDKPKRKGRKGSK